MNPLNPSASGDFLAPEREPDRNDRLIPMINIVFLLLTFFMIAGTFRAADLLTIEPPEAASDAALSGDGPVVLVDRDGVMALGGEKMDRAAIVAMLKQQSANAPVEVRLRADRATRVNVILPLLKALSQAGINHVRLVAVRKEQR